MVKERYRNSVKNAHAYPGADADSDHNLVVMKVQLQLKQIKKPLKQLQWNLTALKGAAKEKFSDGVRTRLQNADRSEGRANAIWKKLKEAVLKSAEENIALEKRRAAKKPWVTEEMICKMDERKKLKNQNTEEGSRMYRRLNNELRRKTDHARDQYW